MHFFSVSYALRAGPRALVFINIMGVIWDSIFVLEGTIICYHGNPNSGKDVGLGLCEPRKSWTGLFLIRTITFEYEIQLSGEKKGKKMN